MKYKMFSQSLPGTKYIDKGWACQDNSGKKEFYNTQVIAVADGHGSVNSFRSEHGSSIAIDVALKQVELFCKTNPCENSEEVKFSETGIANFEYSIWKEWFKKVKEDWNNRLFSNNIFGDGEIRYKNVEDKYKKYFTSMDDNITEHHLYTAYGTTLILAIAIESKLLLLQIGDGTCIILQRNGEFRVPIPADEDNNLNVTVSLCSEDAIQKFRHYIVDCENDSPTAPVAVFLSSDGVDDCYPVFKNEKYLYRLYSVIIENILKFGFEKTETELTQELLPNLTNKNSKDDITLAYLISEDIDLLRETYGKISCSYKHSYEVSKCEIFKPFEKNNETKIL